MPNAPLHPCAEPSCPTLVPRGESRCAVHARVKEQQRPNIAGRRRYRQVAWRGPHGLREQVMREQGHRCAGCNHVVVEMEIDHIIRPRTDADFYNRANLQGLCASCHAQKTARGE
jgi:5-methylcytosine-specific restriction protein A